jgi:thiol-disulfide isomerase/thioredoxin
MPSLWKKKSFWIVFASFLVLAWVAQSTYRALSIRQEQIRSTMLQEGDQLPASLPLLRLDGERQRFQDFAGGVVLINFWAAWCAPCLKEMPSLYALHEELSEKGFTVLAVSMDSDPKQGVSTLERIAGPAPFPLYRGIQQEVFERFPIEGLPYTVVIDRSGTIRYARPGERDWMSRESLQFIGELL